MDTERIKIKEELKRAREEALSKAKEYVHNKSRTEREKICDDVYSAKTKDKVKKLPKSSKEKKSKHKKSKKRKHEKEKQRKQEKEKRKGKSDSSDSSDSDLRSDYESSSNIDSSNEWVEKQVITSGDSESLKRDNWMTGSFLLPTYSKNAQNVEKERKSIDAYDPTKSTRELNPYWKDGGKGLPTFLKPDEENSKIKYTHKTQSTGNWRRKPSGDNKTKDLNMSTAIMSNSTNVERSSSSSPRKPIVRKQDSRLSASGASHHLIDQEMNEIGAKIIKAEIMGNVELTSLLKEKLVKAREAKNKSKEYKEKTKNTNEVEHVLLTTSNSKGLVRPLPSSSTEYEPSRKKKERKNVDTHQDGKRIRYLPDDRYDIKQMFEREKCTSAGESDAEFVKIIGKQQKFTDDLDDIFSDKIRKQLSEAESDKKETERAIREHVLLSKVLESCDKCFDSPNMNKDLLISVGTSMYLSLPWYEGLQTGHCIISSIHHESCSTQLDEDQWSEVNNIRNSLIRMFASNSQEVIFFELVRYLNKRPHMSIHCIPSSEFEMAPFYFKKAIQESEELWSTNKQLIVLKDKDIRRAVPKGLPYFWVHFGMESGFAHVIEDPQRFPNYFAQEIIGGMLKLDPRKWRRPRKELNHVQKVRKFVDRWTNFNCFDK